MANFSLYISGQTELGDLTEFFQKRLLDEGETPIAFFDGVFYESHQERVGNIVYQDYLIFSDKALYLWARGTSKDFLDRFTLGAVSVNSRNKDSAFATMNLKIRREGKEPVFVIFDMVEIREAETIIKLQTAIESTIEDYLGVNYRHEIPPDTAGMILQAAQGVCPPKTLFLPLESPEAQQTPAPDAGIGYGQDLLEQYRAMGGQSGQQPQPPQGTPKAGGMGMPPEIGAPLSGLETMLPTDPASLKRVADQIKSMVGNAPFKLRDQVMKDLQHVPGDVATVLTALNELLANIAGNPMAERFVMNAIKTAVANDGMIGSLSKIIKMTGLGGGGKKSAHSAPAAPGSGEPLVSRPRKSPFEEESEDGSPTIRRKKISVQDDPDNSESGLFTGNNEPITSREKRKPAAPPEESAEPRGLRKKISIKMEDDNEIARKLMSYDESERDKPAPEPAKPAPSVSGGQPVENGTGVRKKKLSIKNDEGSDAETDIVSKLRGYDEKEGGAITTPSKAVEAEIKTPPAPEPERPVRRKVRIVADAEMESKAALPPEPEQEAPARKKIRIVTSEKSDAEPASGVSAAVETVLTPASKSEPKPEIKPVEVSSSETEAESEEPSGKVEEYMTMESDDPSRKATNPKSSEQQRSPSEKSSRRNRRSKEV